jgi:hypothetical protein
MGVPFRPNAFMSPELKRTAHFQVHMTFAVLCSASVWFDPSDNFCGFFECYTRNIIQREHKQSWIGCRQVRSFRYKASIVPSVSTKAINPNNTTSCGESVSMDLCSTAGGEI